MKINFKNILVLLLIIASTILLVSVLTEGLSKDEEFEYSDLVELFQKDLVTSFEVEGDLTLKLKALTVKKDEGGNEIYKHAVRCTQATQKTLKLIRTTSEKSKVPSVETWGTLGFAPGKVNTVKIVVQLSTGERPTVYEGVLEQG